ncbi:hypothetical protein ONS96_010891 [Cadophora gregata f. sp. sojae]|nr:hypothetical protein ONS96_010891 [Cadophora gregata f. sp. sojae]
MDAEWGSNCIDTNDVAFGKPSHCTAEDFSSFEREWLFWLSVATAASFVALAIPRLAVLIFCRGHVIIRAPLLILSAKLITSLTFACLRLGLLILDLRSKRQSQKGRLVVSSALDFAAACLLVLLSPFEHFKSIRPSVLACVFLLLAFIYDLTRCPLLWPASRHVDNNSFIFAVLFTAIVPVEFLFLILESIRRRTWVVWDAVDHSPEETGSVVSLALYAWLNPLLWRGYRKPLTMKLLYPLDPALSVRTLDRRPSNSSEETSGTSAWQLGMWLARSLGGSLVLAVFPRLCLLGFTFCQPFFIQRLLRFLSSPDDDFDTATGLVSVAIFIYLGIAISTALYWYYQERFQTILRAFLISAIYGKTANMTHDGDGNPAAVTLMGADVERVYTGLRMMHEVWANAIQIPVGLWLLQRQLGLAFLAPLVLVLFGFSISFIIARYAVRYQTAWMESVQGRTGLTSAVLGHIKDLRVSGLTNLASKLVKKSREDEIKVGGRSRTIIGISASFSQLPQALAPALAFAFGPHSINQTQAFTSLSLLALLTSPLLMVLQILPIISASFACLRRIKVFLDKQDRVDMRQIRLTEKVYDKTENSEKETGAMVTIDGGSFGWTDGNMVQNNINLQFPKSSINFVVGPVASGKSTLCRALLGEVPHSRGSVTLKSNKLAYSDQKLFLFNASIIENIVGFSSFDMVRYADVLRATMLIQDLDALPLGDKTIIGTKGIMLSGGQRQRVSLARALYHHADILILDDVLSGLDGSTQDHVCRSLFGPAGLLRERGTTTVVCTHAIRFSSFADQIIALATDGTIVEKGAFSEIVQDKDRAGRVGITDFSTLARPIDQNIGPDTISFEIQESASAAETRPGNQTPIHLIQPASAPGILIDKDVWRHWLSTIGVLPLAVYSVLIVGNGFFSNFPTIWLKMWSADSTSSIPEHSFAYWIGLYALLGASAVFCVLPAGLIMLRTGVRLSGTKLHHITIDTAMHSSLRFLGSNEVGKILNLFSQDMNILDTQLPRMVSNMCFTLSNAIGQSIVIALSSGWLAVSYPIFVALLWGVQRIYLPSSKRLRILDLESKTPLYTNFLDTLAGLPTIRAFGWFPQQIARNNALLDNSQRPSYLLAMAQQWLMLAMNLIVSIVAVILVALATQLRLNAGSVGAGLVTLITLSSTLTTAVIAYTGLETSLGAISRLKSFEEDTELEDRKNDDVKPDKSWPMTGLIEIENVDASYTGTDKVLKGLTLSLQAGAKVAICGRTGSGKSSIIALLLRLIEPMSSLDTRSLITIDGIPLNTINHTVLRERIISASQDAVFLPEGSSFRANVDPWNAASDVEVNSVLHDLHLSHVVEGKGGLNSLANGAELSAGQKQLFTLARAVLRKEVKLRETGVSGGLLLLDEITASVDAETEQSMKRLLEVGFKDCIVVMVTHRKEMAMSCDRVIMMDAGTIVEDGTPEKLLMKEGGWFRGLWENDGISG